ncbi:MAG: hypothetical protein MUF01_15590 [Bryobacterales bacterium]|jgi:hypothetical protein|nr:hypothetical protein [Bryobacterales bacterium]
MLRNPAFAALLLCLCCVSVLLAQTVAMNPAPMDLQVMRQTERELDGRIERFDTEAPMYVIGAARGMYVAGTGAVYSVEVSLAPAVGITPFFQKPGEQQIEKIYRNKKARVPVMRDLMLSTLPELAVTLRGLPDEEEVVVAVTLFYFRYEKVDGLPKQMVVRGNAGVLRKLHASSKATAAADVHKISKVVMY